jgi:hypothetical protein
MRSDLFSPRIRCQGIGCKGVIGIDSQPLLVHCSPPRLLSLRGDSHRIASAARAFFQISSSATIAGFGASSNAWAAFPGGVIRHGWLRDSPVNCVSANSALGSFGSVARISLAVAFLGRLIQLPVRRQKTRSRTSLKSESAYFSFHSLRKASLLAGSVVLVSHCKGRIRLDPLPSSPSLESGRRPYLRPSL